MSVNLRPMSQRNPLVLNDDEYTQLIQRKAGGWSQCADEREWLAKLHYLRTGFKAGKLDDAAYKSRENQLVANWLKKLT